MTDNLNSFETKLLHALREEVVDRNQMAPTPVRAPRLRRIGVAAAAVAAAGAGFLILPGIGSTPAYSVQEGNAGEIVVEINRPEDAEGLEQALAEHGITADITYLSDMQVCAPGRYEPVDRDLSGMTLSYGSDSIGVTLPPGTVHDGETFVLTWSVHALTEDEIAAVELEPGEMSEEWFQVTFEADVAEGTVAACTPVPGT